MPETPQQTAPIAPPLRELGSLPPLPQGACSCGSTSFSGCSCEWGRLIKDLVRVGYALPADLAADALPELRTTAERVMTHHRRKLLARLAQSWRGPVGGFLERFNISRTTYDGYGLQVPKQNRR